MASLVEVKEPYVRVQEKIVQTALNPTAGEDLILGCALIADSGPSIPTLISSQKEFLATFSTQDLTKDYINSLNKLYDGDVSDLASTMWLNAYRLAGSNTLLVVRASKAKDINFAKPLVKNDNNTYLLRDGQLLKKVPEFKLVVDVDKDTAEHTTDGWSIAINGIGVIGNRNTDDGAQYDYFVKDLGELVEYLNDTSKFFSPWYTFFADEKGETPTENMDEAVAVVFHEVYLGSEILDTTEPRCIAGLSYVVTCEPDWDIANPTQKIIDLNANAYSSFDDVPFYAVNQFNSSSELKVRIRRFNHDAVLSKELSKNDAYEGGNSPYVVLGSVLDTFHKNGAPKDDVLYRDFYEVAVVDPSLSGDALYFNVGNILGRGDMALDDLNNSLSMIQLQLPDDLSDLNLGYYGYLSADQKKGWAVLAEPTDDQKTAATAYDKKAELPANPTVGAVAVVGKKDYTYVQYSTADGWQAIDATAAEAAGIKYSEESLSVLNSHVLTPEDNDVAKLGSEAPGTYYIFKDGITQSELPAEELYIDLSIDPAKYKILNVNTSDLLKALDQISENEVYVVEGLADLGCTEPMVQSYMANMAINDNYFDPISTINSTNYLAIANGITRISQDHYKLYASAPWDADTGTVGWKFYAAPSTLYWETVARNRGLGREFAPTFGQNNGIAQYQKPVAEFNKKTRQLLLSRFINTPLWNYSTSAYNWNDNYTKTSEDTIMRDDANSRLAIRISKAIDVICRQFKGRRINATLWTDVYNAIDYWFKTVVGPMTYGIDGYRITIDESNNPDELIRQNKLKVLVEVRYQRSLKYVEVVHKIYDQGVAFTGME